MYDVTKRAVDRARRGDGVTLIELMTYRRKGHAEHDNQSYVPAGEIERWERDNDPIARYAARLRDTLSVDQAQLDAVDDRVRREVDDATDVAERSGLPDALDALNGVYADPPRQTPLWFREGTGSVVDAHERAEGWGTFDANGSGSRNALMAEITYLDAIREALFEEMERDVNVFCLGEDIGKYGGAFKVTEGLSDKFGEARVIDSPISEIAIVGAAAGAAHMGHAAGGRDAVHRLHRQRVRHADELRRHGALSCVFALPNGRAWAEWRLRPRRTVSFAESGSGVHPHARSQGGVSGDGDGCERSHEGRDSRRRLRAVLRAQVSVPSNQGRDAGGRSCGTRSAKRVSREKGRDLSIITYAATVWKALEAAEQVEKEDGLSVEVIDLRSLSPLDDEAIQATVRKTNRVLVVHEDTRTGGIAGEITARINESSFAWLDAPVLRVTAHDVPLPYAPSLEDFVLPQVGDIVRGIRAVASY